MLRTKQSLVWGFQLGKFESLSNDAKKNEFASFQTLSRLFGPTRFVKYRAISPGVEFLRNFIQLRKEKGNFVLVCSRPP